MGKLPDLFSRLSMNSDISVATAQKRRMFLPTTKLLGENNIKYRWGHPTKLLTTYQEKMIMIITPEDASKKLQTWGIGPTSLKASCNLDAARAYPR